MTQKLLTYRSVLSDSLIKRMREFSYSKPEHRLNITSWEPKVVGFSGPIMLFDLDEELQVEVKAQLLPILELEEPDSYDWQIVYTLGSRFSFVPWHGDEGYVRACTVYLNDNWDRNWAGMFVYEPSPGDFRAIYPEHNKAVVLYPPLPHTTTMPAIDAPLRETLQVFVKNKGSTGGY